MRKKFKYSTVISTLSKHITIFRTLSIDIWQLKCQQRLTKHGTFFSANFSELSNLSTLSFWEKPLWNQKLFLLTATAQRSCYILVRPFTILSCFPFFGTNFRHQNKSNVVETISCYVAKLSKKIIAYIICLNT